MSGCFGTQAPIHTPRCGLKSQPWAVARLGPTRRGDVWVWCDHGVSFIERVRGSRCFMHVSFPTVFFCFVFLSLLLPPSSPLLLLLLFVISHNSSLTQLVISQTHFSPRLFFFFLSLSLCLRDALGGAMPCFSLIACPSNDIHSYQGNQHLDIT